MSLRGLEVGVGDRDPRREAGLVALLRERRDLPLELDATAGSQKCQPHSISYEVAGTLVSGSLTLNSDGTYSGSLTVHVTNANKHAKIDENTDKAYTIANARVNLHGANPAALVAGSRVKLEGKLTALAKKCDQTGFTAGITIAHADLEAPKTH